MDRSTRVTAAAPASVGNVAVGFDILGHAVAGPEDRVTVRRLDSPEVRISGVEGVVTELPREPERNTAGRALLELREVLGLPHGFELWIDKGIPLGSGMGGSAASCVAALVAASALLDEPAPLETLYRCAMTGESVASGAEHGDNVGAQLLGGLVLATRSRPIPVPVPAGLTCVLVHPDQVLETRAARAVLGGPFELGRFVEQSANLALVLTGCYGSDLEAIRAGLSDVLVEPLRAPLVQGFGAVKTAALEAGALGASISGGGPSVFAWCTAGAADRVSRAMSGAFQAASIRCESWISPVAAPGARVIG